MATRATITFTHRGSGYQEHFYHHWDGYTTNLGLELFNLIEKHYDANNASETARITKHLTREYEVIKQEETKQMGSEYHYEVILYSFKPNETEQHSKLAEIRYQKIESNWETWTHPVTIASWRGFAVGNQVGGYLEMININKEQ